MENTFIEHIDLLEMFWHEPQTTIATFMQV